MNLVLTRDGLQDESVPYTGGSATLQCVVSSQAGSGTEAVIRLLKDSVEVTADPPRVTVGATATLVPGFVFERRYVYNPVSRLADSGSYTCEGIVRPTSEELRPFVTNGNNSGGEVVNVIGENEVLSVNFLKTYCVNLNFMNFELCVNLFQILHSRLMFPW